MITLITAILCSSNVHAGPSPIPRRTRPLAPPVSVRRLAPSRARYNARLNPVGLLFGTFDLGFDVMTGPRWTFGPVLRYAAASGTYSDREDYAVRFFGFGARGTWYRRGVFRDGLYLAPRLTYVSADLKFNDRAGRTTTYDASGLMLGGLVGYGWFWDHFNLLLGGGVDVSLGAQDIRVRDADGGTGRIRTSVAGLALELSLGWTF